MDMSRLPRPEPAAGVAAYNAELQACLAANPRAAQNYQRYLANRNRRMTGAARSTDINMPVKLDIENTSRCNFACKMCAVSTWPKGKRADDMPLAEFKKLIDEQYGLVEIKLNGLGEALMQGDDYFEMIKYARARRIWVRITTNASLLHLRDNHAKLIDSGVNEIDISIDGASSKTFEGIRINSDFDRVRSNCLLLNTYAKERGRPSAKMWTLVQRLNYDRLPDHVPLAADLGFDHLVFSTQLHGWGSDALAERNRGEMVSISEQLADDLVTAGLSHGVRVAFWDVSEKFSTAHQSKLCPWPFERAVVTSDLRTVPCCMIGDPDAYEIGKGQSFLKNWSSAEYRAFRAAHLDGKIPNICKACYR